MQTPFITDLRAKALSATEAGITEPALTVQYYDEAGRHVGTSVILARDFAEQARAMLALAEATALHAVGADGAAKPPRHHFPMMRDVRIGEAA